MQGYPSIMINEQYQGYDEYNNRQELRAQKQQQQMQQLQTRTTEKTGSGHFKIKPLSRQQKETLLSSFNASKKKSIISPEPVPPQVKDVRTNNFLSPTAFNYDGRQINQGRNAFAGRQIKGKRNKTHHGNPYKQEQYIEGYQPPNDYYENDDYFGRRRQTEGRRCYHQWFDSSHSPPHQYKLSERDDLYFYGSPKNQQNFYANTIQQNEMRQYLPYYQQSPQFTSHKKIRGDQRDEYRPLTVNHKSKSKISLKLQDIVSTDDKGTRSSILFPSDFGGVGPSDQRQSNFILPNNIGRDSSNPMIFGSQYDEEEAYLQYRQQIFYRTNQLNEGPYPYVPQPKPFYHQRSPKTIMRHPPSSHRYENDDDDEKPTYEIVHSPVYRERSPPTNQPSTNVSPTIHDLTISATPSIANGGIPRSRRENTSVPTLPLTQPPLPNVGVPTKITFSYVIEYDKAGGNDHHSQSRHANSNKQFQQNSQQMSKLSRQYHHRKSSSVIEENIEQFNISTPIKNNAKVQSQYSSNAQLRPQTATMRNAGENKEKNAINHISKSQSLIAALPPQTPKEHHHSVKNKLQSQIYDKPRNDAAVQTSLQKLEKKMSQGRLIFQDKPLPKGINDPAQSKEVQSQAYDQKSSMEQNTQKNIPPSLMHPAPPVQEGAKQQQLKQQKTPQQIDKIEDSAGTALNNIFTASVFEDDFSKGGQPSDSDLAQTIARYTALYEKEEGELDEEDAAVAKFQSNVKTNDILSPILRPQGRNTEHFSEEQSTLNSNIQYIVSSGDGGLYQNALLSAKILPSNCNEELMVEKKQADQQIANPLESGLVGENDAASQDMKSQTMAIEGDESPANPKQFSLNNASQTYKDLNREEYPLLNEVAQSKDKFMTPKLQGKGSIQEALQGTTKAIGGQFEFCEVASVIRTNMEDSLKISPMPSQRSQIGAADDGSVSNSQQATYVKQATQTQGKPPLLIKRPTQSFGGQGITQTSFDKKVVKFESSQQIAPSAIRLPEESVKSEQNRVEQQQVQQKISTPRAEECATPRIQELSPNEAGNAIIMSSLIHQALPPGPSHQTLVTPQPYPQHISVTELQKYQDVRLSAELLSNKDSTLILHQSPREVAADAATMGGQQAHSQQQQEADESFEIPPLQNNESPMQIKKKKKEKRILSDEEGGTPNIQGSEDVNWSSQQQQQQLRKKPHIRIKVNDEEVNEIDDEANGQKEEESFDLNENYRVDKFMLEYAKYELQEWCASATVGGAVNGEPQMKLDYHKIYKDFMLNPEQDWLSLMLMTKGHGQDGHLISQFVANNFMGIFKRILQDEFVAIMKASSDLPFSGIYGHLEPVKDEDDEDYHGRTVRFNLSGARPSSGSYKSSHQVQLASHLKVALQKKLNKYAGDRWESTKKRQYGLKRAFNQAFQEVHDKACEQQDFDAQQSGCTLTVVLIDGDQLYCANVGDTKVTLVWDNKKKPFDKQRDLTHAKCHIDVLTSVHTMEDNKEKQRIIRAMGEVRMPNNHSKKKNETFKMENNSLRIYHKGKDYPGIAVTRTIGNHDVQSIGVLQEPDISVTRLDRRTITYTLFMGSPGLWSVFTPLNLARWFNLQRYEAMDKRLEWSENICRGMTPFEKKTLAFHTAMDSLEVYTMVQQVLREARTRWIEIYEMRLYKEAAIKEAVTQKLAQIFTKPKNQGLSIDVRAAANVNFSRTVPQFNLHHILNSSVRPSSTSLNKALRSSVHNSQTSLALTNQLHPSGTENGAMRLSNRGGMSTPQKQLQINQRLMFEQQEALYQAQLAQQVAEEEALVKKMKEEYLKRRQIFEKSIGKGQVDDITIILADLN